VRPYNPRFTITGITGWPVGTTGSLRSSGSGRQAKTYWYVVDNYPPKDTLLCGLGDGGRRAAEQECERANTWEDEYWETVA